MRIARYIAVVALIWSSVNYVLADEVDVIQCGTELIRRGDPELRVLNNCGEPAYREGDKWFYNRGPTQFDVVIYMDEGLVTYMEELETKSPGGSQ